MGNADDSLRATRLVFYKEDIEIIGKCLLTFLKNANAQCALLVDKDGHLVTQEGEASAYDMVLNGVEIGGGSLRIYRSDVQAAMFKLLGLSEEEAREKFGFFIEALQYGTPPHGGIAFGVDRLAALLCGVGPIRDVIAFPKTARGHCLMSESPSAVMKEQLDELGVFIQNKK